MTEEIRRIYEVVPAFADNGGNSVDNGGSFADKQHATAECIPAEAAGLGFGMLAAKT